MVTGYEDMELKEFGEYLEKELERLSIVLEASQIEKMYRYMYIIKEWNEKINLTAIVEEKEMIVKHFVDSLTIKEEIGEEEHVLDLGTGAGFPGIPLNIAGVGENIVLMDSLNKRIQFLNKEVIEPLALKNIIAVHGRAEEMARLKEYRENMDIVTSRAVASLNVLAEYMLPFVEVGGKCICMKGPKLEEELKQAEKAIQVLGGTIETVKTLEIGEEKNIRNIVILRKERPISSKFPRKAGMPSKEPIR